MKAIFLDIETTGLDPVIHKPIDIAFKVIHIPSWEQVGSYQSLIYQTPSDWEDHDPVSLEINGFVWEDISKGKDVLTVRQEVINLFQKLDIQRGKAVFICQNPSFDRAFFIQLVDVYTQERSQWPCHWLDLASMYWALLAKRQAELRMPFPEALSLSKNSIANLYNLPTERHPHRAMQGVDHLISCYQAIMSDLELPAQT
jgi:DNA polymerase-3 subunit epsilon/oligoribonuclease